MLRKLANCLIGGQWIALLITSLVFHLNPHVPLTLNEVLSVGVAMAFTYGLACGVCFWVFVELFEVIRNRELRPAWLSFRVLTWLVMLSLVAGASLYWHNVVNLRLFVLEPQLRDIATAATVVSGSAAILLLLGLFHYSFGRKGAMIGYALFALSLTAAGIAPFLLRQAPMPSTSLPRLPLEDRAEPQKLTILGIEGASLSYVLPEVTEGRLPNFARLIEGGASGALRTLYPTESLAVWTSVATGKLPRQHGVFGFYHYRFPRSETVFTLRPLGIYFQGLEQIGLVERQSVSSAARKALPFWSILSRFGVRSGLVRWWGSYPAEELDGFVVSEYLHRQFRDRFEPPLVQLTFPSSLSQELESKFLSPEAISHEWLDPFVDRSVTIEGDSFPWEQHLRQALSVDLTHHAVADTLRAQYEPQVLGVYYFGLDRIGHYFTRYHRPASFGDVSEAEIAKYGRTIDAYYRQLDALLGDYLQRREDDEILLVVSGHGMDPLPIWRRVIEPFKGNPHLSGYHEQSPEGLVILNGAGIANNVKLPGASVVDIAPTILYLMGLPLGRDLDGTPLTDAFEEEFTRNQPLTFISSYDNFLIEPRRDDEPLAGVPRLPDWIEIPN